MRGNWDLKDALTMLNLSGAWSEVDFANIGRCIYKMRGNARLSAFNISGFMRQSVRNVRIWCEREGIECPWDSDGDLLPKYAKKIPDGFVEFLTVTPASSRPIVPVPEQQIAPSTLVSIDFSTTLEEVLSDLVKSRGNQGMVRRDLLAAAVEARPDTTHESFKAALDKLFEDKTLAFKPHHMELLVPYESVPRRGRPPGSQRKGTQAD